MGALCIDADRVVAGLLEDRDVLERIRKAAGSGVFEGDELSKKKLAELIFTDRPAREAVEGIIHPMVMERIEAELSKSGAEMAVVEVPLLYEKGYEDIFDKVIAVYADEQTALARLGESGVSRESARRRLAVQMPADQKIKKADYVINNQGDIGETAAQAGRIYGELTGKCGKDRK